jgi:hypothetical protein
MIKSIVFIFIFFCAATAAIAQDTLALPAETLTQDSIKTQEVVRKPTPPGNFIKLNLMGLPMRNVSLQYERALSKRFSLSLGLRIMPDGSLPLLSTLEQQIGNNDPDFLSIIRSVNIKNTAITPELRWYPGKKGYGRGFYLATYYRYLKADISSTKKIELEIDETKRNLSLQANLKVHNFGLMMGAQWMLSKRIFLDWWIIGAQAGFQQGELSAVPDIDFTDDQIAEINNDISINFEALGQTTQINKKGLNIKTNSFLPFTGLRTGLCLGVRF